MTNVDDEGVELGSGVMELTQCELVLRPAGREPVHWPYLCLRRYGYDSNLFSFESGRRCQTGQGESHAACTRVRACTGRHDCRGAAEGKSLVPEHPAHSGCKWGPSPGLSLQLQLRPAGNLGSDVGH